MSLIGIKEKIYVQTDPIGSAVCRTFLTNPSDHVQKFKLNPQTIRSGGICLVLIERYISVRMFVNAASTFVESKADVSIKDN